MNDRGHSVRFSFGACDETIIARAIVGATDQLCSMVEMSLDLLDALEYRLIECVAAVHRHGITRASVSTHDQTLRVELGLDAAISSDLADLLGAAYDIDGVVFTVELAPELSSITVARSIVRRLTVFFSDDAASSYLVALTEVLTNAIDEHQAAEVDADIVMTVVFGEHDRVSVGDWGRGLGPSTRPGPWPPSLHLSNLAEGWSLPLSVEGLVLESTGAGRPRPCRFPVSKSSDDTAGPEVPATRRCQRDSSGSVRGRIIVAETSTTR